MTEKFFITKEELKKLQKEYEELQKIKLSKLQHEAPQIFHSEDLDAEYLTFREEMNFLEAKLAELEKILKNYQLIVLPPKKERNKIYPGAKITLKDSKGKIQKFQLVGSFQANPKEGKISIQSPLGKSLFGKKVGDKIVLPFSQKTSYTILKIEYNLS